jgi:hypothetical protein
LQQANWSQQVSAAQAHTNLAQRSTAMVALVRQALGTTLTVHEAPVNSSVQLEQADYHSPPEINFDVRLNQKQRRSTPGQGGATPPLLSNNVGYTFHTGSGAARRGYSILGPMVLGTGGEGYVRMYADHELYHATHHSLFQGSNADMELEAWTDTFRRHFVAMAPQRQAWTPLITDYEGATTSARATALAALRAFAQGLPATAAPGATESDRSRFDAWLRRRLNDPQTQTKALVVDLALALGVAVTPPPAPSQNAQPPNGPSPTPP